MSIVDGDGRCDLERIAGLLEATGDYRILRRMIPRRAYHEGDGTPTRRGVFIDVETTGLDPLTDEVIELAIVPFDFTPDGRIVGVHEAFDRLRDPGRPIPAAITALTGITEEMVAGKAIDPEEVVAFLGPAVLVLAHNAGFDRRFAERFCGAFAHVAWACSWVEVPWADEGFQGARLSQLAAAHGFFYDGHRAVHDCHAGIDLLARSLPKSGRFTLGHLLESARQPRWRVWATGAPFELKNRLKERRYRWADGGDGGRRAWYLDVPETALEAEKEFLRREIYGREDVDFEMRRITAYDRYSDRV